MITKGMFKNVDEKLNDFIQRNSNKVCPEGKYDNTVVCTQSDLIRFVNPIIKENKELKLQIDDDGELPFIEPKPISRKRYKFVPVKNHVTFKGYRSKG